MKDGWIPLAGTAAYVTGAQGENETLFWNPSRIAGGAVKAEWDESKHPRDHGRFAVVGGDSGGAEGSTGEHPLAFIDRYATIFRNAGGQVALIGPRETYTPQYKAVHKDAETFYEQVLNDPSTSPRVDEGAAMMIDALDQVGDGDHCLVATEPNGRLAAALNFQITGDSVHIDLLGSSFVMDGAPTALQLEVAKIASDRGLSVESSATPDAVGYHEKIGRTLTGSPDETGSVIQDSKWTREQVDAIARLKA